MKILKMKPGNGSAASQSMGTKPHRLNDIDVAKGLAIVLVVFGHIVARESPEGNAWYIVAKEALYSFHMAFFMFLSGVVFFLKDRAIASLSEYFSQLRGRFVRLMPSYFLLAGTVFVSKWVAQYFVHVDNPVDGWNDLAGIFLYPMESISAFLWYVYVLFQFCVVGLSLAPFTGGSVFPIVGLGLVLLFVPGPSFLGMDQFCKYLLFFALGGLAIRHWDKYKIWVRWTWPAATVAFILMLVSSFYQGGGWVPTALLSLVALHGLCNKIVPYANTLRFLGLMSFPIYLMNTLSIGFVKALMLKFVTWDGSNFLFFAPVLFFAGLWIPVLVKQCLIRRVGWLDKITS